MSFIKRNGSFPSTLPAIFDDIFNRDLFNWNHSNFPAAGTIIPSVNVRETPDHFDVEVAVPGMKKADFKIELDGSKLTISSQKQKETASDESSYSHKEFSYSSFRRSFVLPKDVVDNEGIGARYEDGLLLLTIPKKEEAKQRASRQIEIK